jgi:hypothetical protein
MHLHSEKAIPDIVSKFYRNFLAHPQPVRDRPVAHPLARRSPLLADFVAKVFAGFGEG